VECAVLGHGSPLIVLESGLGDDLTSWNSVFGELSKRACTLAYSRAGLGASTPAASPRDVTTEAQELWELLEVLGEPPPFILVGHSWGGLIVQALAASLRDKIGGIVLVDPAHPDLIDRLHRDTPADAEEFDRLAAEVYGAAAQEELKALGAPAGGHFAGEERPYPGPMLILAAWMFSFNQSHSFLLHHRQRAEEIAGRYPQAELRRIYCAHQIQRERPLAIVDAVDEVLARSAKARS